MAIHPTAIVDPGAQLDSSVEVGARALVGDQLAAEAELMCSMRRLEA